MVEFAAKGLHGTSTEDIAKRAGISQPWLFRLFGTKKTLAEACRRCMRDVAAMAAAAAGKSGEEALDAMGAAYVELLAADRAVGSRSRCTCMRRRTSPRFAGSRGRVTASSSGSWSRRVANRRRA